ncbi:class I adenylate-forming enzyme family protein [Falsigemmobacter faecalis]|uniref:Long-chain fatty acid--CoA ligase n=1 Tax=Falsigemmobacter faecalis TaxID=2488730 RepID=A0A3P3DX94_9RHOB|nr:AMP-binding protein [Falsigemmobacter faecalis]RRH78102.1 long-chain fatty acid--CoA ligase [Falsigemmobacter faecalis]
MRDPADFAALRAGLSGDDPAFHDHSTGRIWSFAAVNAAAETLAADLSRFGRGARIAHLAFNRAESFITLFAAQKAGQIFVPLNWRAPVQELRGQLDLTTPPVLICDEAHLETARALGPQIRLMAAGGGFGDLSPAADFRAAPADPGEPLSLLFTSGSTGAPRAVIQTARMAQAVAVNIAQGVGLNREDRSVCYLPLCHTGGINLFTLPLFLWGGQSHILPKYDPEKLAELLHSGALSQLFAVPTIWQDLHDQGGQTLRALADLRGCASGGAPFPEGLARSLQAAGVVVQNGYGMTESGPTGFLADRATALRDPVSVGRPQMHTRARIEGGTLGELQMAGETITPGYFRNPEATAAAFTADGWLRTGDLAQLSPEGGYRIIGRVKEMYISGGENVWPAEVEAVLQAHPGVREAAVIAVPDARWGEAGLAFLIPSGPAPEPEALTRFCRERLAAFKVPRDFRFAADLPRSPSGKIRKSALGPL